jgi:hypothetical protein
MFGFGSIMVDKKDMMNSSNNCFGNTEGAAD